LYSPDPSSPASGASVLAVHTYELTLADVQALPESSRVEV